jgi:hypothetical protein
MTASNRKEAGSPIKVRMRPRFSSIHRMNLFFRAEFSIFGPEFSIEGAEFSIVEAAFLSSDDFTVSSDPESFIQMKHKSVSKFVLVFGFLSYVLFCSVFSAKKMSKMQNVHTQLFTHYNYVFFFLLLFNFSLFLGEREKKKKRKTIGRLSVFFYIKKILEFGFVT